MKTGSLEIRTLINKEIKKGDTVRLIDGSGLSHIESTEAFYIIYAYYNETGLNQALKHIDAEVLEVGVCDYCVLGAAKNVYLQDIVIKIGNAKFRTSSKFVHIQEEEVIPELTMQEAIEKMGFEFKIKQ